MILRLIMGDQLSPSISSLGDINPQKDIIWMCEIAEEATTVKHHKKKIAFIFSAMRHFAEDLKAKGYRVHYTKLDDENNGGNFEREIKRAVDIHKPEKIVVTEPSEYRVLQTLKNMSIDVPIDIRKDNRFLCDHQTFQNWAKDRKQLRMEYFYREMRKKYHVLMNGPEPEGGSWNYDQENRKPPKEKLHVPKPYTQKPDAITLDVMTLVKKHFGDHFGDMEPFYFAVTRKDALKALALFIHERLKMFGDYQDAMIENEHWMYHAHLSFYLNCGLLLPLECIEAAEQAYHDGIVPLNAAEGFIRQIMGWREYVRGIYWLKMPDYEHENFLNANRKLPNFFWTADTHMNCMKQCISETKSNAYAHHIQRLMVLGNFTLLTGIHPDEVNAWYYIVYADAFHWVELPNVTGMILFADGGILASKPYAASGAYIHKMSNYCKNCVYDVKEKNGPKACPFNYLYWHFLMENAEKLSKNQRLSMIYRTLARMDEMKKTAIEKDSTRFLTALENNEKI